LEKRAEQVLPGSGEEGEGGREEREGEMAQTMYTHMNKCINKLKNFKRASIHSKYFSIVSNSQ
jgi:hypothetical protein